MRLDLAILGLPVRFEADRSELLDAASTSYNVWPAITMTDAQAIATIYVHDDLESGVTAFTAHVAEPVVTFQGPGVRGEADTVRGVGQCWLARSALHNEVARTEALDTIVLFLLTAHNRLPLHAAGVMFDHTAALFAGATGSGKSTLAAHAQQKGLLVLSDDVVFVQVGQAPFVWGYPRPMHLVAADAPVDAGNPIMRRGKLKVTLSGGTAIGPAARAALYFLERAPTSKVSTITKAEAVQRLDDTLDGGFDRFRDDVPALIDAMTEGCHVLTVSTHVDDALQLVAAQLAPQ